MYLGLTILLNVASCYCYVAYEMFPGFNATLSSISASTNISTTPVTSVILQETSQASIVPVAVSTLQPETSPSTTEITTSPVPPVTSSKFQCPEEEQPSNIGAYEVPTQRDIALLIRKTLIRLFNKYHEKALFFLKDIKEASKATAATERKCNGFGADRIAYKKCVRHVSNKCDIITKGLVTSLESQRLDVEAFTNGTVCSVKEMKADPVELVKTLAMEKASLEFALPGFLRLLSACSIYCNKMEPQQRPKKPLRHMTDQDLVVKHFLTNKNYIQLIKGSK